MPRRSHQVAQLERHDLTGVERFAGTWTGHQTQHHAHPEYQITLTMAGRGHLTYLGGRAVIPAGCLVILHPGEPHILGTADRTSPWSLRSLHIPPHWFEANGPLLVQPVPLVVDPSLERGFDDVWQGFAGQDMAAALTRLARLLRARPGLEPDARPRSDLVRRCLEVLAAQLDRPMSMIDLAQSVGATTAQVRRAVTQATGLPPLTWHLQRRIGEAKHLLAKGGAIVAIAGATGFADQAHFTRHFTRLVGVSPARYAAGVQTRTTVD